MPEADIGLQSGTSHSRARRRKRRLALRWLDVTSTLEPAEDAPTECGPGGPDAPAGEHISWIVNAKINAANANGDHKQPRQAKEIDLES